MSTDDSSHRDLQRVLRPVRWFRRPPVVILFAVTEAVFLLIAPTGHQTSVAGIDHRPIVTDEIRVPIEVDHTGYAAAEVDPWLLEGEVLFRDGRFLVMLVVLVAALASVAASYFFASQSKVPREEVTEAAVNHATDVGKLVAGLAHEIRNPLHAIRLNLHTVRRIHEKQLALPPEEMAAMLEQSVREIDRIEHLLKQLLGFATPDEPREELIDVGLEVRDMVEFIHQEMLDSAIETETRIPREAILVSTDRGRLRQVMLNLLENARQAMSTGGCISVCVEREEGRVEIRVSDTGPGIPEADRARIFDPFFSTKAGGTGLGLAMVKRFVREAQGEIMCESRSPNGTTFRILLPEAQT